MPWRWTYGIDASRGAVSALLLIGSWKCLSPVACRLHAHGHAVLMAEAAAGAWASAAGQRFQLAIAEVATPDDLAAVTELVRRAGCPWLALDAATLITEAFESGAVSVLPAQAEPALVERAALSLLARLGAEDEAAKARTPVPGSRRRYRAGDPLPFSPGQMILVEEGVLARMALHEDGTEVLLGFVGPGGLVAEPREDLFTPALFACSEAEVSALPWEEAMRQSLFPERLRDQLTWSEAWSAAQARPHLGERLKGIIELLARQFGRPHVHGILIDFRVTHAQLAQAIGATRSTVTRLLAGLRRSGWLQGTSDSGGEKWIVRAGR